eukprot:gene17364-8957_t
MDERHWWIATKLQQTFKSDQLNTLYANFVEDFLADQDIVENINEFISSSGSNKLIFYCQKPNENDQEENHTDAKIAVATSALKLKDLVLDNSVCVVLIRTNIGLEIEPNAVEKEIFALELKQNTISSFSNLLSSAFLPFFRAQSDWGECYEHDVVEFLMQVDKYSSTLQEYAAIVTVPHHLLKRPNMHTVNELKQSRLLTLNPALINEYESLVQEWIHTIETLLSETLDERPDVFSGPLSELEIWQRRQKMLLSVADQLKNKECKTVIGILITAKSRVLKKWKIVDAGLTDAINETKDKVKYLESLRRYFDQLYEDNSPSHIANNVIPSITAAIRQMDNISKFYARSGYLGIVFAKITNQLVMSCRRAINSYLKRFTQHDAAVSVWNAVESDIVNPSHSGLESSIKSKKGTAQEGSASWDFITTLRSCLQLHKQYRDQIRHLKDSLGGSHALQHIPALSFGNTMKKYASPSLGNISTASSKVNASNISPPLLPSERGRIGTASVASGILTGIAFTDEEAIIGYFDLFAHRVHNLIDIVDTVKQFSQLQVTAGGLPILSPKQRQIKGENGTTSAPGKPEKSDLFDEAPIVFDSEDGDDTLLSEDESGIQESNDSQPVESVSKMLAQYVGGLKELLKNNLKADNCLIIDGKGKNQFETLYADFIVKVEVMENFIINYIKDVFNMKWKTQKALDILKSFKPVISRLGLRPILSEKYIEAFIGYEKDLDEVKDTYEQFKENPQIARNSPRVAGSIFWSRSLLRRIEEPMKVFKDVKFVSALKDFTRVVKYYNRLAAVLVKFEELLLISWKSQIDVVKVGLKASLLRLNEDKKVEVNVEKSVLEVMNEVKWMKRLNLSIPNSATEVSLQETRFKNYYHKLHWIMQLYNEVCENVPVPLRKLMTPLTESILYYLQPGLSTLTWSSLNIDAYLHQCHVVIQKLQKTVDKVRKLVKEGLADNIEKIKQLSFFDESKAVSRTWTTNEFVNEQKEFSAIVSKRLSKTISGMETALQQITSVIVQQMLSSSTQTPPATPGLLYSTSTPTRLLQSESRTSSSDPYGLHRGSRNPVSPPSGILDDAKVAEVKVHYCSQVYEAVVIAINESLMALNRNLDWMDIGKSEFHGKREPGKTEINFDVQIEFLLPDMCVKPSLSDVQGAIKMVADDIVDIGKNVHWWAKDTSKTFYSSILAEKSIKMSLEKVSGIIMGLQNTLDGVLMSFKRFDFLWQDDLQVLFKAFSDASPGLPAFHREVERLQKIERDLVSTPDNLELGPLVLSTIPIKDCLYGFAIAWKICYAQPIHESAKVELKKIVDKRESFRSQLTSEISSLDQLNKVLNLLQELYDLENTIDDLYLPVETTYKKLLEYDVKIARDEVQEVNGLREKWSELLSFASEIRWQLLQKKRTVFEQELDKQVKTFVVEVIQFRNSFDSQGPGVPGVIPSEAVRRLKLFHDKFRQLDYRRKVLDAVQIIFGIAPTPFPELNRTGEELEMLEMLYGLYQKFINFDQSFREQLWAEADLLKANQEVNKYWKDCTNLPSAIRSWTAYKEMRDAIRSYIDVFPLLNKLASREIRNRHWLEVMAVTGTSFQLEANVFKLMHLLDSQLAKHKEEIEEIVQNAGKELDLEIRIRAIEEEWTEQVLNFERFKNRGLVCIDKENTEKLLEIAEDAKSSLAIMLTSKHVAPLRDEAASWAVKLKEVGEVLDQWLSVQELWQCLEEVFSNSATAKELPQESSRFARVDRGYMKTMKKAVEIRNVMQCCVGGDVPKNQMLKGLYEELEICFKSLAGYLNKKRKDVVERLVYTPDRKRSGSMDRMLSPIIDGQEEKPLSKQGRTFTDKASSINLEQTTNLEEWKNDLPHLKMVAVSDAVGEKINLDVQVRLENGVECWLKSLLSQTKSTLKNLMQQCRVDIENGMSIEDWTFKYPSQVVLINLFHIWTLECESGISEIRVERKALAIALRRYTTLFNKIPQIIARGAWRNSDVALSAVHQSRLESLISVGLYLRDILEDLGRRKLREASDFEWQRNLRFYFENSENESDELSLALHVLNTKFDYGYEFTNCKFPIIMTSLTERCFVSLTQAVSSNFGGCLQGPASTGKTQTIKGFAHLLGRFLISISCLKDFEVNSIGRIFTGVAQEAAWCLFDEFQQASSITVSVITYYAQHILNAIRSKQNICYLLDSQQISVMPSLAIFTTATSTAEARLSIPQSTLNLFREICLVKPDYSVILRTHLAAQGFKSYKMLADKIRMVEEVCLNQL